MEQDICKEAVYRDLFYQHANHLRNFAYYKCGNLEEAEDLMQDAFSKLWENCSAVQFSKVKSWLFTIVNNTFLNTVKHQKVVLKFQEQQPKSDSDQQDPQYLLEEKEFKAKLMQAINDLPEDLKLVFLMNRIDKKKYREIAEELNLSVKAIEKRMHKALSILRKIHKKV